MAKTVSVTPTPPSWAPPANGWVFEFPDMFTGLKENDHVNVLRVWPDAPPSSHSFRVAGLRNTAAYLIEETYARNAHILRLIYINMSKEEMIYEEINIFESDKDWLAKTVHTAKFLKDGESLPLVQ